MAKLNRASLSMDCTDVLRKLLKKEERTDKIEIMQQIADGLITAEEALTDIEKLESNNAHLCHQFTYKMMDLLKEKTDDEL
tara:strand:+ start:221 stop:463 length:243 start_codon:yes stop_codon:yes gene_type:complete